MRKAQAHCPYCLSALNPKLYYCPKCGEGFGELTPYIPFVNIRFQANWLGRVWRAIWGEGRGLARDSSAPLSL
jgi:hypothetical protein